MASRRSRRGGEDSVQERLATLAAMKQLMGDPMRDLGGLMSLQRASEESEQGRRDEERAVRSEAFAREQLDALESERYRDYRIKKHQADLDAGDRSATARYRAEALAIQKATEKRQAEKEAFERKQKLLAREEALPASVKNRADMYAMFGKMLQLGQQLPEGDMTAMHDSFYNAMAAAGIVAPRPVEPEEPEPGEDVGETLHRGISSPAPVTGGFYGHPGGARY